MATLNISAEKQSTSLLEAESTPMVVFQPQKLTEIVEMIDLMGSISERVREDSSGDMGGGGGKMTGTGSGTKSTGPSARDIALQNLPVPQVMQIKLTKHIHKEIRSINRQVSHLSRSHGRGSAFVMNELYKKMRRLYCLIEEIAQASADMIRRFYIAVFVDRQPVLVTGSPQK